MKRLDEIPKKSLFEAPEGYFERLPGRIQDRLSKPQAEGAEAAWGRLALRYALPVVILASAALFVLTREPAGSPEEVIASLETEELVAYLQETDVNIEDLLESIPLDGAEVDVLEADALGDFGLDDDAVDALVDEFD